jgi:cobalt-zinc-cadmium efflux system outer membrane protein
MAALLPSCLRSRLLVALAISLALPVLPSGAQQPASSHAGAPTPRTPLTLPDALARARSTRPQVSVAAAGVDRARGAARVATLIPNPQSSAQADERTPTRQATMSQPLGWLVRRGADAATGRALVARASADSAQLLADLGRDVQRAFYGALAAEEALRLTSEQARFADSLVVLADRRVTAGDISALERDQIAQEASRARLAQAQARAAARLAGVELARAVAWDGADTPRPVGALADALDSASALADVPRVDPAELSALPALQAALADSATAAARLRAARLAQIPIPAIVAGVEWGTAEASVAGTRDARTTPIFGLSVPLPLWSRGGEAAAEARGAAREGGARAAEARLAVAAGLAAARIQHAETAGRARFARDSLFTEATRIRAGAVRLYEAGRTGLLPVLDALRVERDVARTLVQELLAFQEARADLTALLGRWP